MTKKIFIILIFVLALFSMQKIYAMTISDEIEAQAKEKLDNIIEIKQDGVWKDLEVNKYNVSDGIIYELGNNTDKSSNITISEQIQNDEIITILANGYYKKSPKDMGVNDKNDAYLATKIALDCIEDKISKEDVRLYYRAKENIDEQLKLRAESVIEAVENLLTIPQENYFNAYFIVRQIGKLEQDEFNEDYCSQKYEITTYNCTANNYSVLDYTDFVSEAFSTNNEGDIKEEFNAKEDTNIFRIAIPKEYRESAFNGFFELKVEYQADMVFLGTAGNNKYIILTSAPKSETVTTMLLNKRSSININVIDKEKPNKYIKDVKIKVKDENNLVDDIYTTDKYGMAFVTNLGKGNVKMEVLEIPANYTMEQSEYNKDLAYSEYCEYKIGLKYKKGSLKINNNVNGATFEIYDNNSKFIGAYQTNEDGQIEIEEIDIGEDYILKQTNVPIGYKLTNNIKFSISYNQVTTIDIFNEEEMKEDDNSITQDEDMENDENDKDNSFGGTLEKDDKNDTGGAIKIPQKEDKKEENQEQSTEENKQEEIEKNEDEQPKTDESKNASDVKNEQSAGAIEKNDDNQNTIDANVTPNEAKDTSLNKLPRTGYDFPEINPLYIVFAILILIYILKRTAMSQSIQSRE